MALVEELIKQDGSEDYVDITGWSDGTAWTVGTDVGKGIISDNEEYDETVALDRSGGSTSTTSYMWLTTAAANQHGGKNDVTKARWNYSGGATAACLLRAIGVRVSDQNISRNGVLVGGSDECFRTDISGRGDFIIERCLVWTEEGVDNADMDGIYFPNVNVTGTIANTCVYGFARGGIHIQNFSGANTYTIYLYHLHLTQNGLDAGGSDGNFLWQAGAASTAHMYNTVIVDTPASNEEWCSTLSVQTANGSHNCRTSATEAPHPAWDTDNRTNWVDATAGHTDVAATADSVIVANWDTTTIANMDLTPIDDSENVILAAGVAVTAVDSRVDLSVDIAGNARPTSGTDIDIGAHQITVTGGGPILRTVTDDAGLVDAATTVTDYTRSASDAAGLTDTAAAVATFDRTLIDALGLVDNAAGLAGLGRSPSDALGLTDTATRIHDASRVATDPVGLTDSTSSSLAAARSVIENLGLTDALSAELIVLLERTATDALGLVDVAARAHTAGRTITDELDLSDTALSVGTFSRSITEGLGLTDTVSYEGVGQILRTITDAAGLTDNATRIAVYNRTTVEGLGLVDQMLPASNYARALSEGLGLTDTATAELVSLISRTVTDGVDIADQQAHVVAYVRTVLDAEDLTDQVAGVAQIARQLVDALGLVDQVMAASVGPSAPPLCATLTIEDILVASLTIEAAANLFPTLTIRDC